MQMIFHVGISKTGSTAIQTFLENYADLLGKNGYWLPGMRHSPSDTISLSGNGYDLCLKIEASNSKEFPDDMTIEDYLTECIAEAMENHCEKIIFSSESFSSLNREKWIYFASILGRLNCEYLFVVFEREPYSWYFSSWLQQVKRCGLTGWLDTHFRSKENIHFSLYPLLTRRVLEKLFPAPHCVHGINFEDNKEDILGAFLDAIEFRPGKKIHIEHVNPAMTAEEFFLFYSLNKVSKGNLSLTVRMLRKFVQQVGGKKEKFFFCNKKVQKIIYDYLDDNEVEYRKDRYERAQNLSEDDFFAKFSAFERAISEFYSYAFEYFADYHENIISLAMYKIRFYANSKYRDKVPASFNVLYYLLGQKDVLLHDIDPYMHYFLYGQKEGRKSALPGPF